MKTPCLTCAHKDSYNGGYQPCSSCSQYYSDCYEPETKPEVENITFRLEIENTPCDAHEEQWRIEYRDLPDLEEAHAMAYTLADKGYYKIYEKIKNNSLQGYHWVKRT